MPFTVKWSSNLSIIVTYLRRAQPSPSDGEDTDEEKESGARTWEGKIAAQMDTLPPLVVCLSHCSVIGCGSMLHFLRKKDTLG